MNTTAYRAPKVEVVDVGENLSLEFHMDNFERHCFPLTRAAARKLAAQLIRHADRPS
jgi:hypothetical protein